MDKGSRAASEVIDGLQPLFNVVNCDSRVILAGFSEFRNILFVSLLESTESSVSNGHQNTSMRETHASWAAHKSHFWQRTSN